MKHWMKSYHNGTMLGAWNLILLVVFVIILAVIGIVFTAIGLTGSDPASLGIGAFCLLMVITFALIDLANPYGVIP